MMIALSFRFSLFISGGRAKGMVEIDRMEGWLRRAPSMLVWR